MDHYLALKTHRPAPPPNRVARPLLIRQLNEGLSQSLPMTLVSAPAGFGKTTCVAEWLAQVSFPVAWLSLDAGDNDPGRFFASLSAALQAAGNAVGQECFPQMHQIERILRSSQLPPATNIAMALIADILDFPTRILLVLDDFHVIQERFIAQVFETLILNLFQRNIEQPLHLVLITREDPPMPLARLRANNHLTEIRAGDLRFSEEEAGSYLNEIMGLGLSESDILALKERTEGWAAGLQLAGLSMRGRPDPSNFIRTLSGSHRFILSYLTEEVLSRQPEELQRFLLETSILERLSGELCNAITGRQDSQLLLEQMSKGNLFLIPLDEDQHWYRFHHLFADLLRNRQSVLLKKETAGYHARAARWFAQAARGASMPGDRSSYISAGVKHALAAEEFAVAVQLIEDHVMEFLSQWYAKTVSAWIQALPADWSMKSPMTSLAFARMHLMRGDIDLAAPYLERLQALFASSYPDKISSITPALRAEWLALQASLSIGQGKPAQALELAQQALAIAPENSSNALCQIHLAMASAYQQMQDIPRAEQAYQRLIQIGRASVDTTTELWGLSALALMVIERGQLHRGYELALRGAELIDRAGLLPPICAGIYGELGQVYFHWHRLDLAERYLQKSAEVSRLVGFSDAEIFYAVSHSRLCLLRGDIDGAAREIQRAVDLMSVDSPAVVREEAIAQQIIVNLAQDNLPSAEQTLFQEMFVIQGSYSYPELLPEKDIPYPQGVLYLSALRILLYRTQATIDPRSAAAFDAPERGVELADSLLVNFRRRGYAPLILQTLIIRAQIYAAIDHLPDSLADLQAALDLAEPEDYLSDFVMQDPAVARLLSLLIQRSQPGSARAQYIQRILDAFPAAQAREPVVVPAQAENNSPRVPALLLEALTEREREVLRLIAEGRTYEEIAVQLVVSINTIRTHIKAIYGKLAVNNRTAAIDAARKLNLL